MIRAGQCEGRSCNVDWLIADGLTYTKEQLRDACIQGDLRAVQEIVGNSREQLSADQYPLSITYDDDCCGCPLLYLAAGSFLSPPSSSRGRRRAQGSAQTTAAARAEVLRWLLANKLYMDMSIVNSRCETALHCCLLNGGSLPVLNVLLEELPHDFPVKYKFDVHALDVEDRSALEVAVSYRQWGAVHMMITSGALEVHAGGFPAQHLPPIRGPSTEDGFLPVGSKHGAHVGKSSRKATRRRWDPVSAEYTRPLGAVRMTETEVVQFIENLVDRASAALGVQRHKISALMARGGYDLDALVKEGDAWEAVNKGRSGNKTSPSDVSMTNCIVCFDQIDPVKDDAAASEKSSPTSSWTDSWWYVLWSFFTVAAPASRGRHSNQTSSQTKNPSVKLECGHMTCDECWRGILNARLDEGDVYRAVCPYQGCGCPLPLQHVNRLLPAEKYRRFSRLLAQHYVNAHPKLQWCPNRDCGRAVRLVPRVSSGPLALKSGSLPTTSCWCDCGTLFCCQCLKEQHEPATCGQATAWEKVLVASHKREDGLASSWISSNTRQCPGCQAHIEKNGGCLHMTCTVCRHEFCWVCLEDWKTHNLAQDGHYNCSRYVPEAPFTSSSSSSVPHGGRGAGDPAGGTYENLVRHVMRTLKETVAEHKERHYVHMFQAHNMDHHRLLRLIIHMSGLMTKALGPREQVPVLSRPRCCEALSWESLFWRDLYESLVVGKQMLKYCFVVAFYLTSDEVARYLEPISGELNTRLEQLLGTLEGLPHASKLPTDTTEAAPWLSEEAGSSPGARSEPHAEPTGGGQKSGVIWGLVKMLLRSTSHVVNLLAPPSPQEYDFLTSGELVDQVSYVAGLAYQREVVGVRLEELKKVMGMLQELSHHDLLGSSMEPPGPIKVKKREVLKLAVTNSEVAWDLLTRGWGALWRR